MISRNKQLFFVPVLLMLNHCLFAQSYQYKCTIDTVQQTGFHKIILSPELSRYCKTDLSDIRIIDTADQFIPYIIRNSFPILNNISFLEFPIIKYELTDSGRSLLIIEDTLHGGLYKLSLLIKNAAVSRVAILSGSNDNKHWFVIDENLHIKASQELIQDYYEQSFQLPVSDYKYLKLLINNAGTDPLNIQKAGCLLYDDGHVIEPQNTPAIHYLQNPAPNFTQKDSSDGSSYIKIINPDGFQFDNIGISNTGTKFFSRNSSVFLPSNDSCPDKIAAIPIAFFHLQSGDTTFDIPRQNAKIFYLVITNNDNAPLKIANIATRQTQNEIVAYLEKGKQYFLLLDNPLASAPNYDLEKFKDSIPPTIDPVSINLIVKNKQITPVVAEPVSDHKAAIWIVISLAGLLLIFFTLRLTKEMKRS